jgi:hypothetical protein
MQDHNFITISSISSSSSTLSFPSSERLGSFSLPAMQANPPDAGYVTYDLEHGSEWRFELEENEALAVRVSSEL